MTETVRHIYSTIGKEMLSIPMICYWINQLRIALLNSMKFFIQKSSELTTRCVEEQFCCSLTIVEKYMKTIE